MKIIKIKKDERKDGADAQTREAEEPEAEREGEVEAAHAQPPRQ